MTSKLDDFERQLLDQITALTAAPASPAAFRAAVSAAVSAIQPGAAGADIYPLAFGILAQNARVLAGLFIQERARAEKAERELTAHRAAAAARQVMLEAEDDAQLITAPLSPLASASTAVIRAADPDEHSALVSEFDAATRSDYPEE